MSRQTSPIRNLLWLCQSKSVRPNSLFFYPAQWFVTFKARGSVANIVWISLSLHLDYQSRPFDLALLRNAVGSEAVINDLHHQSPTQPHNKTKRSHGRLLPAIKLVTVFCNTQNTKWYVFVFASTYRYTEITTFTVKKKTGGNSTLF